MKKTAVTILAVVLLLALTACAAGGGSLAGTWTGEYDEITFQENGTALWAERGSAGGTFGSPDEVPYTASGNTLTFDGEDECTFRIDGNTLVLDFGGEPTVLIRK